MRADMISGTSSFTSSFQLRLVVTVIISIGNLFMLIAISTNHWINGNGEAGVTHVGLWKICVGDNCFAHSFIIYSKVLLIFTILFGIICNVVAVLAVVYDIKDIKSPIARTMFATGVLAVFGMISATAFLVIQTVYLSVSYGLLLAWVSTVLYIVAGFISWVHYRFEPDEGEAMPQLKRLLSRRNQPPPMYTENPPPGTVIVS